MIFLWGIPGLNATVSVSEKTNVFSAWAHLLHIAITHIRLHKHLPTMPSHIHPERTHIRLHTGGMVSRCASNRKKTQAEKKDSEIGGVYFGKAYR